MQDAERAEREAAAQAAAAEAAAAEAQAGEGAGAASHQASDIEAKAPTPGAEAPRVYSFDRLRTFGSGGDSHNSQNSGLGDEPSPLPDAARPASAGAEATRVTPSTGSGPSALKAVPIIPEIRGRQRSRKNSREFHGRQRKAAARISRLPAAIHVLSHRFLPSRTRRMADGDRMRRFRQLSAEKPAYPFGKSRNAPNRPASRHRIGNASRRAAGSKSRTISPMSLPDREAWTEAECAESSGGSSNMAWPAGWDKSPLLVAFHPTVDQIYEEALGKRKMMRVRGFALRPRPLSSHIAPLSRAS
jgi:hypothetical protein